MSIVYLTAGAAGMYCGSCMHDNSVAKALIRLGESCLLTPVYTPIRTDEKDASVDRVFFGGINVYLQQKLPWISYLPRWMDSALNRPSLIRRLTAGMMKTDPRFLGALTVSMLRGMEGNQRKEVQRLCHWLSTEVHPKQIILTNMLIAGSLPELKKRLRCSVFATLQGDDIFLDSLPPPYHQQAIEAIRRLVPYVDGFVVHSRDYGDRMAETFRIPNERFHVLPLGIEVNDFVKPFKERKGPMRIGYLARMAPEKGLHLLIDAYVRLLREHPELDAVLELAGWMGPQHLEFWNEQKAKLQKAGLMERCTYHGSIDRDQKIEFLQQLDLLCVPTVYREPKGLFVLEAAAAAVPYVLPSHGAFPEVHARLQFGRLFPPNDVASLSEAILASIQKGHQSLIEQTAHWERMIQEVDIQSHAQKLLELLRKGS